MEWYQMALICADVPLSIYSLTHSLTRYVSPWSQLQPLQIIVDTWITNTNMCTLTIVWSL